MEINVVEPLALALGLGLLVGMQREWTAHRVTGIRTVTLITVLGALLGLLSQTVGVGLLVGGLLGVVVVLAVGTILSYLGRQEELGLTSEIAALVMYGVGVALAYGQTALGLIVGGGVAVLLQWKQPLHTLVGRFSEPDVRAIFNLVLIALVILPVLPNQGYGPYGVLNPFEIWLMVVLIVGISVGGFIAYKFLGARAGTLLGAVLGGLISSTATTVSYARRTRHTPAAIGLAAFVIMIASTIVFGRVLFEIGLVAPELLSAIAPPLVVVMALMGVLAAGMYWLRGSETEQVPLDEDPSQLKAAVVFGLLYAAILFSVAAGQQWLGNRGLYLVAALSGLTDMDAITLSTAQLIKRGELDVDTGWRMILLGSLSNIVFKGAAVAVLGHRRLLRRVSVAFGVVLLCGGLLWLLWP
ncbi:MAG: MgtC/SapB family protein [Candidatus Anammoximicrobium sp.]|mgnify:CR=1 FL=1|nr:MgtC/SapB family protein [Candidatus Anammoximicrobium sp.]